MSAGGQRGTDLSGITGMRLRDSSDFVAQVRLQETYQMFNSATANAVRPRIPNGNDYYLQFLQSTKEGCGTCVGLPYGPKGVTLSYRN
jgi:hypothetical protein